MRNIQSTQISDKVSDISRLNLADIFEQLRATYSRGNAAVNMRSVSADTTLTHKDSLVFVDTSGGNVTITLPYANSWGTTKSPNLYIIKTSTSNTLTIAPQSGDTLSHWDGVGTLTSGNITTSGQIQLVANGTTGWYALSNSPTVYSGTYTPTLSNTTNIGASTAYVTQYMRVGNVVTVGGKVSIDVTTTATDFVLGVTLPIASAFTAEEQCGGTFIQNIAVNPKETGFIKADTTNDRAYFSGQSVGTANYAWYFSFTYLIV